MKSSMGSGLLYIIPGKWFKYIILNLYRCPTNNCVDIKLYVFVVKHA